MGKTEDEDTASLRLPKADGAGGETSRRGETGGELSRSEPSPIGQWHTRTYEFATAEAALLCGACAVALAMARGVWPIVELYRTRLRLRLPVPVEPAPSERAASAELADWAWRLGGREVA